MKRYLKDLLARLSDDSYIELPDGSRTSEGSISVLAHQEIANFDKVEAVFSLKELYLKEKNSWHRVHALRLLLQIATKHDTQDIVTCVFDFLKSEKTNTVVYFTLDSMLDLEVSIYFDPFLEQLLGYLSSKDNATRHAAIRLLGKIKTHRAIVEDALLDFLSKTKNEYDLEYVANTLAKIGFQKSIEPLKNVLTTSKVVEVQRFALYAIDAIDGENQLDFYLSVADNFKAQYTKETFSELIAAKNDAHAIPYLTARLKYLLSKKRPDNTGYTEGTFPELVHIFKCFKQLSSKNEEINAIFDWIKNKKMDYLLFNELEWWNKNNV